MVVDKNRVEINPGDEVVVRGIVKEVMPLQENGIVNVDWQAVVPLVAFVKAENVEVVTQTIEKSE